MSFFSFIFLFELGFYTIPSDVRRTAVYSCFSFLFIVIVVIIFLDVSAADGTKFTWLMTDGMSHAAWLAVDGSTGMDGDAIRVR